MKLLNCEENLIMVSTGAQGVVNYLCSLVFMNLFTRNYNQI